MAEQSLDVTVRDMEYRGGHCSPFVTGNTGLNGIRNAHVPFCIDLRSIRLKHVSGRYVFRSCQKRLSVAKTACFTYNSLLNFPFSNLS